MTNETDRELLELAAKAASLNIQWMAGCATTLHADGFFTGWNPLADDGDALRLAVRLKIAIYGTEEWYQVTAENRGKYADEPVRNDPYLATRRAITRAAAEIGRGMV